MSESADNSLGQSPKLADLEEDWDENEEEYDEEDGDDDIDAQAEEMARKLNEQLWEDMRRAAATESISSTPMEAHSAPASTSQEDGSSTASASSHKEEAVLVTIKAIMALLTHDPIAHNTLASTALPSTSFSSVLDALNQILTTRTVSKAIALVLSQALVTLVGSEVLFGALKGHDAQAKLLGKRKREEEPVALLPSRHPSIYDMVSNAVHIVTHALHTSSSINPALINSIQDSLQHIFLFSISLSARPVEEGASTPNAVLQEISGLIQVLGVLSGIQIGVNISHEPGQTTDTITMVYPCIVPSCNKTFIQLANLRTHEHAHHSQSNPSVNSGNATATYERPFPCTYPSCSASFLRNHDLKRHVKVAHERKSFKCGGCGKTFSRRDAIKRHKDASMTKSQHMLFPGRPVLPCYEAEVVEVEGEGDDQDGPDDDDSSPDMKRARTDDDLGTNALQEGEEEEGEISEETINSIRAVIMQLHPLLRAVVAKASGTPLPLIPLHSSIETVDPPATHSSSSSPKLISDPALISTDEHPAPQKYDFSSSQQLVNALDLKPGMEVQPNVDNVPITTQTHTVFDTNLPSTASAIPTPCTNELSAVAESSAVSTQHSSAQSSHSTISTSTIVPVELPSLAPATPSSTDTITASIDSISILKEQSDTTLPTSTSLDSQPVVSFAHSSPQLYPHAQSIPQHGLSDYQIQLLEQAITGATQSAQAQAQVEADLLKGEHDENGVGRTSAKMNGDGKVQAEMVKPGQGKTAEATSEEQLGGEKQAGNRADSDVDADGEVDTDLQNG